MKKTVLKIFAAAFCAATAALFAVSCGETAVTLVTDGEGKAYEYVFDQPMRATPDAFMTIDGKLDEPAWQEQNYMEWEHTAGVTKYTTIFTEKGVYVGAMSYDTNVLWEAKHAYNKNTEFYIQIAKEDEVNLNDRMQNQHPMHNVIVEIDAKNSLCQHNNQYEAKSYVKGELNSENTEYMSAELFVPWNELHYTEDELNEYGLPSAIRLYVRYAARPNRGLHYAGLTDEGRFKTYYTFDEHGLVLKYDSPYVGHAVHGEAASDQWIIDDENKTATSLVDRTQILWIRQDDEGNAKSRAVDFIAETTIKPEKATGSYPHCGFFVFNTKTLFSIYAIYADALLSRKNVQIITGRATDGGQWVGQQGINRTVITGYEEDSVRLKLIKQGGNLYYFVNGEYFAMEYVERVKGECIIGFFTNGRAEYSDWSFKDYSDKSDELTEILRGYVNFVETSVTGGGDVTCEYTAVKDGLPVPVRVNPRSGWILGDIKVNGESRYDEFVSEANNALWSFVPDGDVNIEASFERLPSDRAADVSLEVVGSDGKTLMGEKYVIKGDGNLFIYSGESNSRGFINVSMLKKGAVEVGGKTFDVSGEYTLEMDIEGYEPVSYGFTIDGVSELEERITAISRGWGAVTVNGLTTNNNVGKFAFDKDTGKYTTDPENTGNAIQYYKSGVMNGDYVIDADIKVLEDVGWKDPTNYWTAGDVVGVLITAGGGSNRLMQLKAAHWETGKLCLNLDGEEVSFNGFATKNLPGNSGFTKAGAEFIFKVIRYNNVIYVYNAMGQLGFTLAPAGVTEYAAKANKSLATLNEKLRLFFSTGTQNGIGMVCFRTGIGYYMYDVDYSDDDAQTKQAFDEATARSDELIEKSSYILSQTTVNGKDYAQGYPAAFVYNPDTGYYEENLVYGQKEGYYKDKADGDYVAYFDLHTFDFSPDATGMKREAGIVIHGGAPTGDYAAESDLNLKIMMGTNPAGNAYLFMTADDKWPPESHIGGNRETFYNPAANPKSEDTTLRLAIVRANDSLAIFVKTYSTDNGATTSVHDKWPLLVRFHANKDIDYGAGITRGGYASADSTQLSGRVAELIKAPEHMFAFCVGAITLVEGPEGKMIADPINGPVKLGYKLALEQDETEVADFLANSYSPHVSDFKSSMTVNGKTYSSGDPGFFAYNEETEYYEAPTTAGNKEAYYKEKTTGDYVAYFDLQTSDFAAGETTMRREAGLLIHGGTPTGDYAADGELCFKIWMGTSGAGMTSLFLQANNKWASECHVGGNLAAFYNPAGNPNADDKTLRLAIARTGESIAIYVKTYSTDGGATTSVYDKWTLLVRFNADSSVDLGKDIVKHGSSNVAWSYISERVSQLIASEENMFGITVGGVNNDKVKTGYKLTLEQGEETVAAFIAAASEPSA